MPKYWGKQIFAHGRFPEVGQKQKTERERKRERKKDRTMVITMAKLRMAHASRLGQKLRKHTWRMQAAWANSYLCMCVCLCACMYAVFKISLFPALFCIVLPLSYILGDDCIDTHKAI